jgi:hypothetical protein
MAQSSLITRLRGGNETLSETFNRAFFENDPEFFRNRSIKRQIDLILGIGSLRRNSFPETEILQDAKLIDILYQDSLEQQAARDLVIRTPDLPNPYGTSILLSPRTNVNSQVEESGFIFETQPPE